MHQVTHLADLCLHSLQLTLIVVLLSSLILVQVVQLFVEHLFGLHHDCQSALKLFILRASILLKNRLMMVRAEAPIAWLSLHSLMSASARSMFNYP